ncbi:MAG: glycosyltransferase family 39 protein [Chthoniobacteraceae bacterium]
MKEPAEASTGSTLDNIERLLLMVSVIVLAAYWFLYSLVAPVTVWDSQTYNLARLLIAQDGGLFGNHAWNNDRQILFPWAFDAVHYPFLLLGGWGVALPSFFCFVGILVIVFRILRQKYSLRAAWWGALVLFSLPTVVYQASSTKNDLAVVFGVACWFYAWWLWRQEQKVGYAWWMALALGFATGAKTSGIPLALILGLFTLWSLRGSARAVGHFAMASLLAVLLCGSVETYVNNRVVYGHWTGSPAFVNDHRNHDGLRGTAANVIRYVIGNQNIGLDVASDHSPVPSWLADRTREILHALGLRDVGYRSDFNDAKMEFLKTNHEDSMDFGPVGGLSLLATFVFFCGWRCDAVWKLSVLALLSLGLSAATIAWMPWNARFLMLPFMLGALALTLFLVGRSERSGPLSLLWLLVLLFAAFLYPLNSFNKKPEDLLLAVTQRRVLETSERPAIRQILEVMDQLEQREGHPPVVLLCGGIDSWVLPLLQLQSIHAVPAPLLGDPALTKEQIEAVEKSKPEYVLFLNLPPAPAVTPQLQRLVDFADSGSVLYGFKPSR